MSRIGQEYLTSNRYVVHPFYDGTQALVFDPAKAVAGLGSTARLPSDFMLDASVLLSETHDAWYLRAITWTGTDFDFDFSAGGAFPLASVVTLTVPDTTTIRAAMVNGYYTLTLEDASIPLILRAVCDESFAAYLDLVVAHVSQTAEFINQDYTIQFAPYVLDHTSPKVYSFATYSDTTTAKQTGIDGDVQLIPGYNMLLDPVLMADDTTEVTMMASPGAGQGVAPCEEQPSSEAVNVLMGLKPSTLGAIRIAGGGNRCYEIVPDRSEGQVSIHGTCYACCGCDDYEAVATSVKNVMQRTHALRQLLDTINTKHCAAVDDYNIRHFPLVRRGVLAIQAFKGYREYAPEGSIGAAGHGYLTVKLMNHTEGSMTNIDLSVNYRNAQRGSAALHIEGGTWRIGGGGIASIYEIVYTSNPADGDILQVADKIFEIDADGSVAAGNIAVTMGDTADATYANLEYAIKQAAIPDVLVDLYPTTTFNTLSLVVPADVVVSCYLTNATSTHQSTQVALASTYKAVYTDQPSDGDTLQIDDKVFEIDTNGSVLAGNITVTRGADMHATYEELHDVIVAAGIEDVQVAFNNTYKAVYTDQPSDGDTLQIDDKVFEIDTDGEVEAGNIAVTRGTDADITYARLHDAIIAECIEGVQVDLDTTTSTLDSTLTLSMLASMVVSESLTNTTLLFVTSTVTLVVPTSVVVSERLDYATLTFITPGVDGSLGSEGYIKPYPLGHVLDTNPRKVLGASQDINRNPWIPAGDSLTMQIRFSMANGAEIQPYYLVFVEATYTIFPDNLNHLSEYPGGREQVLDEWTKWRSPDGPSAHLTDPDVTM